MRYTGCMAIPLERLRPQGNTVMCRQCTVSDQLNLWFPSLKEARAHQDADHPVSDPTITTVIYTPAA